MSDTNVLPAGRPPSDSFTEMTEMVLPQHTNVVGTAFGGVIMSWVDICAAISAQRHCGEVAVTARIDAMEFHAPIRLGDVVRLTARVNAATVLSPAPCSSARRPPCRATTSSMSARCRATSAFIASGSSSHRRVESSRSVNTNATIPAGEVVRCPTRR